MLPTFLNVEYLHYERQRHEIGFEIEGIDDHNMNQYLIKFGRAILEGEWLRLEQKSREQSK